MSTGGGSACLGHTGCTSQLKVGSEEKRWAHTPNNKKSTPDTISIMIMRGRPLSSKIFMMIHVCSGRKGKVRNTETKRRAVQQSKEERFIRSGQGKHFGIAQIGQNPGQKPPITPQGATYDCRCRIVTGIDTTRPAIMSHRHLRHDFFDVEPSLDLPLHAKMETRRALAPTGRGWQMRGMGYGVVAIGPANTPELGLRLLASSVLL
ncbi:hypothetical protein MPH_09054 [Macrophomina phaseolina MS6]|uniref:Uncharacterized protein n=1 Tax=Macrophomina phaseolina (strain MS6) TaxID=1126212 RepID=K2RLP2_MACPH|nr:hypothetical protein MPH_09054 [Macrophomina phaseolina MS6]